jgi:hypothetical protein
VRESANEREEKREKSDEMKLACWNRKNSMKDSRVRLEEKRRKGRDRTGQR